MSDATSVNFAMLITARGCQGAFAALLVPSALSLLTTMFTEPKDRSKAFAAYGAIAGAGGAIGLLLGGVVFCLVYGFSNAATHSCQAPATYGFLAAGLVLLVAFAPWQTRAAHPLVPYRVVLEALAHGYDTAFWWTAGIFACGAVVGGALLRRGPLGQEGTPSPGTWRGANGTSGGEPGAGSVTGDSSRAAWLRHARSYLRNADPVLARLIDERPEFDPRAWLTQLPPMDLYGALLFQVTGQQLSVAATRRTLARIEALFGGHLPSPTELLAVDPGQLREAGLSWRKIATLRDLTGRMSDGRLDPEVLSGLPDDELMAQLTAISGIGPWTVQGAMLIALGREDVVLPGDLALRKAVHAAYQLDHLPTPQEVLDIADKWRPYRSLATSYLFSAAFEAAEAPPAARRSSAGK